MNIKIKFGQGNEIEVNDLPDGTRMCDVLGNCDIRSQLGFGDNVSAVVDGERQEPDAPIADGNSIEVVQKHSTKG